MTTKFITSSTNNSRWTLNKPFSTFTKVLSFASNGSCTTTKHGISKTIPNTSASTRFHHFIKEHFRKFKKIFSSKCDLFTNRSHSTSNWLNHLIFKPIREAILNRITQRFKRFNHTLINSASNTASAFTILTLFTKKEVFKLICCRYKSKACTNYSTRQ